MFLSLWHDECVLYHCREEDEDEALLTESSDDDDDDDDEMNPSSCVIRYSSTDVSERKKTRAHLQQKIFMIKTFTGKLLDHNHCNIQKSFVAFLLKYLRSF